MDGVGGSGSEGVAWRERATTERQDGRRELEGSVGGGQGVRACASSERAGATPDRRRPSHTILRTIPPPRQSSVRIRTVNNPLVPSNPGR